MTLSQVTPGVWVATSRREATTSTVVVQGAEALLIDPAWEPDELDGLAAEVAGRGWRVTAGFATHAHYDHLLWHPGLGPAPRWASVRTAELARQQHTTLVSELGAGFPAELVELLGLVEGVAVIPPASLPAGLEVELITHDGHCPGHTALWLPAQRVLIAGDMLSDRELPLPFDPDDLPAYLSGLAQLAPYVAAASWLICGHGTATGSAAQRLAADRRYLQAVLEGREPDDPRLADPQMRQAHQRLVKLAAAAQNPAWLKQNPSDEMRSQWQSASES